MKHSGQLIFPGILFLLYHVASSVAAFHQSHHSSDVLFQYFFEILKAPINFSNNFEEEKCKEIVGQLNEEELEAAARTSYAYWYLERNGGLPSTNASALMLKETSAMKEARRHLVASNGNVKRGLSRLQDACRFRKETEIDSFRTCCDDNQTFTTEKEKKLRKLVVGDMMKQPVIMRGHDQDFRGVLMKGPRTAGTQRGNEEEYVTTQLYIAERASACTEFVSRGRQERMVAMFDFSNYDSSHAPPLKWQLSAIRRLQQLYPERLHKVYILHPPFWMRGVFQAIRPFLAEATRGKIELVTDRSKFLIESKVNDDKQNDNFYFQEWDRLPESLDVNHYLNNIPFYCPYNCEDYGLSWASY